MFELSHLRCFVAVAEELHFGRAAARLNMTQPPLSRQIMLLERELDAQLLQRSSRVVTLTPVGRIFLPEARRIVRLSESAVSWTKRVWRGEAGTLRIGFTAASGYSRVPDLVAALRQELPDVDVVLREMVTAQQMDGLTNGVLDIGLLRPLTDSSRFETRHFPPEALLAALPSHDPLCCKARLTLSDLHRRAFVTYSPDASQYFHDLSVALFYRGRVQPEIMQQVGQIHTLIALVAAGLGLGLVPESASRLKLEGVEFRPIETDPARPVELVMAWNPESENPTLHAFLRTFDEVRLPLRPEDPTAGSR